MSVYVLGSINLDIVTSVETIPRPGETVLASALDHFVGGKGANQAVAAARQGAPTHLIGRVGDDSAADQLTKAISAAGVHMGYVRVSPGQTSGQAFIAVAKSGENAITVALGANTDLCPDDFAGIALTPSDVVLSQLECPLPALAAFFEQARPSTRILNAAPAMREASALFAQTDILVVNETELASYAGLASPPNAHDEIEAAAARIRERPDQVIIATLGKEGVLVMEGATSSFVPGRPVDAVDTTGAGDCFCGALAASLSRGMALKDAVSWANSAAAVSVTRQGAVPAMPTYEEVLELHSR